MEQLSRSEELSAVAIAVCIYPMRERVNVQRQYGRAMNEPRALGCLTLKNYFEITSLSTVDEWLLRYLLTRYMRHEVTEYPATGRGICVTALAYYLRCLF